MTLKEIRKPILDSIHTPRYLCTPISDKVDNRASLSSSIIWGEGQTNENALRKLIINIIFQIFTLLT